MRDLLIRYLLGELDEQEQRRLEERLRQSPELRRELAYLQACFSPAGEEVGQAAPTDLPPGLAERTTEQVTSFADDADDSGGDQRTGGRRSGRTAALSAVEPASSSVSWSFADVSVAAGVFLAVSMLLLPALRASRDAARQNMCAKMLCQLGRYYATFAEINHRFPTVEANECAGMVVLRLVDSGVADGQRIAESLVCPGSPQADDRTARRDRFRIPATSEVRRLADGQAKAKLFGNWPYGFRAGYFDGPTYRFPRDVWRECQVLAGDVPVTDASGTRCVNHDGRSANLLMGDCHVKRVRPCKLHKLADHPYLNADGQPLPGRDADDDVIVPASFRPVIFLIESRR